MTVNAEGQGPSIDVTGDGSEVTVEVTTGSNVGGGGGVDDHGALTGLADDDHLLYEPTATTLDVSGSVTVTTETRLAMAAGGSVTLPDAASRAGGRTLTVLSSGGAVTVTAAGGDNVMSPGQTVLEMPQASMVQLAPVDLSILAPGLWLWAAIDGWGTAFDLPGYYDPATGNATATDGHVVTMVSGAPAWAAAPATGWAIIADDVLLVDTAAVSYNVTGYDQLHVIFSGNTIRNGTIDALLMTVNGDSSSVYSTNAAALNTAWQAAGIPGQLTYTDRHQHVDIRLSLTDGYPHAGYSLRSTLFSTSVVGGTPTLTGLFSTLTGAVTSIELAGNLADLSAGSRIRVFGLEA